MTTKTIIDEDICASCMNCSLLLPIPSPYKPWELPALCIAGWPYTARFWNVISECPRYEKVPVSQAQGVTV